MSTPTKTNHILLGLVGVERSGKDTIADHLVRNHGFKKYSLAAPIRDIGKLMFGWTDDQLMGSKKDIIDPETNIKPRDFLTWFGTEICQFEIYNKFPQLTKSIPPRTIWANMMRNYIEANITTNPIIITDIRFKHEVDTFEKLGGLLIYVSRKGKETPEQLAKYDLTDLITSRIKYVFDNNYDIETSKKMINDLIMELLKKNKNQDYAVNTVCIGIESSAPKVNLTATGLEFSVSGTNYDTSNCSLFI